MQAFVKVDTIETKTSLNLTLGRFHQTFFANQKVTGLRKICCSITLTIKSQNFKLLN